MQYVLGIATLGNAVVMVKKNRPAWQAGKFNFPGGKIEEGETPEQAMYREFLEETGVEVLPDAWRYIGRIYSKQRDFSVHVFHHVDHGDLTAVTSMTDELVQLIDDDEVWAVLDPESEISVDNAATVYSWAMSSDSRNGIALLHLEYF
jgi:8-oxo-dGTP diphosphatase